MNWYSNIFFHQNTNIKWMHFVTSSELQNEWWTQILLPCSDFTSNTYLKHGTLVQFIKHDWSIDCCLMLSEQNFSYIRGQNKFKMATPEFEDGRKSKLENEKDDGVDITREKTTSNGSLTWYQLASNILLIMSCLSVICFIQKLVTH